MKVEEREDEEEEREIGDKLLSREAIRRTRLPHLR